MTNEEKDLENINEKKEESDPIENESKPEAKEVKSKPENKEVESKTQSKEEPKSEAQQPEQKAEAKPERRRKKPADAATTTPDTAKDTAAKPERPNRPPRKRRAKDEEPKELPPSPLQPQLDHFVKVIETHHGKDAIAESYINRASKHVPTIIAKPESYYQIAELLKTKEELDFNYLSDIHGVDYETHMEMYVHLFSMSHKHSIALKVKVDRDEPTIDSLTPIWEGANWPECETYDLLGIKFTGHPDLKRILLGEEWKGHPLRKDYEPYDVEV